MSDVLQELKAACAYIEAPTDTDGVVSRGTGYLVTTERMLTCEHVVRWAGLGGRVLVRFFDREPQGATVEWLNSETDSAVLRLERSVMGITPLPMHLNVVCKMNWQLFGYPANHGTQGLVIEGTVQDTNAEDRLKHPSLQLHSPQFHNSPANGLSGAPVISEGAVIGHLKNIIPAHADEGAPTQFAVIFALPSKKLLEKLPAELATSIKKFEGTIQLPSPPAPRKWFWTIAATAALFVVVLIAAIYTRQPSPAASTTSAPIIQSPEPSKSPTKPTEPTSPPPSARQFEATTNDHVPDTSKRMRNSAKEITAKKATRSISTSSGVATRSSQAAGGTDVEKPAEGAEDTISRGLGHQEAPKNTSPSDLAIAKRQKVVRESDATSRGKMNHLISSKELDNAPSEPTPGSHLVNAE